MLREKMFRKNWRPGAAEILRDFLEIEWWLQIREYNDQWTDESKVSDAPENVKNKVITF